MEEINMKNQTVDLSEATIKKWPHWDVSFVKRTNLIALYPFIYPSWNKFGIERLVGITVLFLFWQFGISYKWINRKLLKFHGHITCECGFEKSFTKKDNDKIFQNQEDYYCPKCGRTMIHWTKDTLHYGQ